jgi:hypothetical protein
VFASQLAVDTLTSAIQVQFVFFQAILKAGWAMRKIWRVWVIWGATKYANLVIVVPLLCFLTFVGKWLPIDSFCQGTHIPPALDLRTIIFDSTLTEAETLQVDAKAEIGGIAIQATITMLCTMLISLYLIFRHWHQRKLIGKKIWLISINN